MARNSLPVPLGVGPAFVLCIVPTLQGSASAVAMSERPRQPPPAEANVPTDLQRVTLQVDGMY